MATGALAGDRYPWLAVACYAVQACWGGLLVWIMLRRNAVPARLVVLDVIIGSVCVIAAGWACQPQAALTVTNSAYELAIASAVVAAMAWRTPWAIAGGVVLSTAYIVGVAPAFGVAPGAVSSAVSDVCWLVVGAFMSGLIAYALIAEARNVDHKSVEAARAYAQAAEDRARFDERTRQYRLLHDTVLSTLSGIARGGLEYQDALVRQRCAADADYLRALISSGGNEIPAELSIALARVGRDQAAFGLRVHQLMDSMPKDVPVEVVGALSDAAREALNNVAKHANTEEAWVTAVSESDGSVTVTIVDRGSGFDAAAAPPGLGLTQSVVQRMADAGGRAEIDSQPGQGTMIELRWPA